MCAWLGVMLATSPEEAALAPPADDAALCGRKFALVIHELTMTQMLLRHKAVLRKGRANALVNAHSTSICHMYQTVWQAQQASEHTAALAAAPPAVLAAELAAAALPLAAALAAADAEEAAVEAADAAEAAAADAAGGNHRI